MGKYGLSLYDTTLMLKFVWQICILLSCRINATCLHLLLGFCRKFLLALYAV